ncbi:MAG: XRE family transcriptional regulator [Kiritimatiellae bacterium]|nr:XRE family transcriptional regulator [Kiritimatiellia bacterium]
MQEKIKKIASRIREMRELSDLRVEEVAARLGISTADYNHYESGEADIPASILLELASIFNVDMGLLLTGEEPRMHFYSVTRRDKGVCVERRKAYRYQNLASNFIHAKAEPFLVTVDPKPAGDTPTKNAHPGQEFNYLLEGRLRLYIRDQEIDLEHGDSIYFDSSCPHAMCALDNKPARFLAIIL